MDDGVNALKRYYLNTFTDHKRQESFDLFLGNSVVWDANSSKLSLNGFVDWLRREGEVDDAQDDIDVVIVTVAKELVPPSEMFINGWVVLSVNNLEQQQERLLLITDTAYYRVKYVVIAGDGFKVFGLAANISLKP